MSSEDALQPGETVLRGLLRLPEELDPATGRPHQDKGDFVRRRRYQRNGPENGLSAFRRCKYPTNEIFYDRIGSKKPIGATECSLSQLTEIGITPILGGEKNDHISLRCPDCDMASKPEICKPKGGASFDDCPFFDKTDPINFNSIFKEVEAPARRKVPNAETTAAMKEADSIVASRRPDQNS